MVDSIDKMITNPFQRKRYEELEESLEDCRKKLDNIKLKLAKGKGTLPPEEEQFLEDNCRKLEAQKASINRQIYEIINQV